jgi:DNA end-binding protein Ku
MAKAKTKKPARTGPRSSWRGQFQFGLVSFAVEAMNALDREHGDIHFNQIHAGCHRRIRYQKTCPVHGTIDSSEIVSGYEYKKDHYVELDPEELRSLRLESDQTLKIAAFVQPETVDPLYFDGRMYYLAPVGAAAREPYTIVAGAMANENRYGIGSVIFSGKDQIVLIRPLEGVLHMAMLNYEHEILPPGKVVHAIKPAGTQSRQMQMARTLVKEWTDDDFDFGKIEDTHRDKVQTLIKAKMKGKKIVIPEEKESPVVLNLMEALKKSLAVKPRAGVRRRRRA